MAIETIEAIHGVVVTIIGPDGHVWAAESDFNLSALGGFSLAEGQEFRATRAVLASFFRATCNTAVADAIEEYHKENTMRALKAKGWRMHVIKIGHNSKDGE